MFDKIITVTLNPALDVTIWLDALDFAEPNEAAREILYAGGKGVNISRVLASLGFSARALGICGSDNAVRFLQLLEQDGVSYDFVRISGAVRENLTINIPDGRLLKINRKGSPVPVESMRQLHDRLEAELSGGGKTLLVAGSVGSTIAYTLAVNGIASEVVLIDVNTQKALGEAMDIRQATPFASQTQIYAGSYSDAEGSNIVIVTSGIARKPGQSRIDLTQTNVNIIKSIIPDIVRHAPNAIYVLVSNPVDILTYVFGKVSGLPTNHVIGSGTILDTARLRTRLAEYFSISQKNIHAYVLGEHGDS